VIVANRLSMRWTRRKHESAELSRLVGQPGDVLYEYGDGCSKRDGSLLHSALGVRKFDLATNTSLPSVLEELHRRGYDLTTLKFSIHKRAPIDANDAGRARVAYDIDPALEGIPSAGRRRVAPSVSPNPGTGGYQRVPGEGPNDGKHE